MNISAIRQIQRYRRYFRKQGDSRNIRVEVLSLVGAHVRAEMLIDLFLGISFLISVDASVPGHILRVNNRIALRRSIDKIGWERMRAGDVFEQDVLVDYDNQIHGIAVKDQIARYCLVEEIIKYLLN